MSGTDVVKKVSGGAGVDLRRGIRREMALRLVERAAHLPPRDRLLVELAFRDEKRVAEISRAWAPPGAGVAEELRLRRRLNRQLHRLVARLVTPEYRFVSLYSHAWPDLIGAVAEACILHGLNHREASERLGISLHAVRKHLDAALALCAGAGKAVA